MNLPNERLIDTVIGLPKTACLCHPCNYWFLNYPLLCIYVHQLDAEKDLPATKFKPVFYTPEHRIYIFLIFM